MEARPALYSKYCGFQITFATGVLNQTRLLKSSYPNVLDIGCGTGEVTMIICEKIPGIQQLMAIDRMKPMVDFAEAHHPNDKIRYKMADIVSPETPRDWAGRFNLVTSFFALHWVKNQANALEEIYRVLAPGGEFLLFIGLEANDIDKMSKTIADFPRWRPYLKDLEPQWYVTENWEAKYNQWRQDPVTEYSKLIRNAGLEVISAEASHLTYTHHDEDDCKGMLASFLPDLTQIPEEEQPDFMTDVLTIFKQSCPRSEDGRLQSREVYLTVHGMKPL